MNIFKQLVLSLYSPKAIATWRTQGIGKTILFVFLLTLISILPTIYHLNAAITNGVEMTKDTVSEEIPNFTITNGELQTDESKLVTIEKSDFTIIFDPTGEIQPNQLDTSLNSIAFLKNDFAITTTGTIEQLSYSMVTDMAITKDDVVSFINTMDSMLSVILPIIFIAIYLFSSALKFIGISVLALIGTLLNSSNSEKLKYRYLWRIAAYSITLPTIFFMIMDIFQTAVPFGFVLNWFVSILVLILALKEIPQSKELN